MSYSSSRKRLYKSESLGPDVPDEPELELTPTPDEDIAHNDFSEQTAQISEHAPQQNDIKSHDNVEEEEEDVEYPPLDQDIDNERNNPFITVPSKRRPQDSYQQSTPMQSPYISQHNGRLEKDSEIGGDFTDMDDLDAVTEQLRKKGRKQKDELSTDQIEKEIQTFLKEMNEATIKDHQANINKEPALNRMKLLPRLADITSIQKYKESLLSGGFLREANFWITANPDGTLPNSAVRRGILQALDGMIVDKELLRETQIGISVRTLANYPRETAENRQLAERIWKRWARSAFGLFDTFKKDSHEEKKNSLPPAIPRSKESENRKRLEAHLDELAKTSRPGDPTFRYTPRMPKPSAFNFSIRPESDIDIEIPTRKGGKSTSSTLLSKVTNKKGPKKLTHIGNTIKIPRATPLSIEGHGMLS
ncbi:putative Protein IWS1 like protein [Monocercomonoides exilis]|uniref:putative Protein IWS1 like protein n=1 Tax=Monocercomonoides exilis TaxID=2049356 RepID=UPI00355A98DD|nr:putative Protein IWS1 like protein [Monocercomonoides exilis]|eukprot:MONOS_178.1-p1 / transcript=MONOS_178.1 / gene=MONOS_178 / organism=Monocercomonoides_exilis_PA203 / gene_product=Protein IWS1 like protein / transcript_product=Protein IWS1 like protein / location=Mono_scaffold00003:137782-139549(+) / protein_length=419 / sequence_SO=supercontig / SO=protein_coding / is_pseudo=false